MGARTQEPLKSAAKDRPSTIRFWTLFVRFGIILGLANEVARAVMAGGDLGDLTVRGIAFRLAFLLGTALVASSALYLLLGWKDSRAAGPEG